MFAKETYFKEGCFIQEWHNSPDDLEVSVAHVRVEPYQTTKLHALIDTAERYVLLHGKARVTVDQKVWEVVPGDVVLIPPGVAQQITNLENDDLLFLAVCTPRFELKNYRELQP